MACPIEIPTVPPSNLVLWKIVSINRTKRQIIIYLRKRKVPVLVAISLIGIAACRAMRGV